MAGSTTKTVQDRIVSLDFQQMVRPRNFPLPHENASGKTSPRTKPELCQHKAGLPLNWVTTDTSTPFPGPLGPFQPSARYPTSHHNK